MGAYFATTPKNFLMLGLDSTGKTTILHHLKLGEVVTSTPTIGFEVETVQYKNVTFNVWDIRGQDKFRNVWKQFCPNTKGLVYVIDSSDKKRI